MKIVWKELFALILVVIITVGGVYARLQWQKYERRCEVAIESSREMGAELIFTYIRLGYLEVENNRLKKELKKCEENKDVFKNDKLSF